jgi:hypothetical protein
MFQCNGNIPVQLQPKAISLEGSAYSVLAFSESIVSPFSEAW